jgi:hypothetical protein
MTTLSSYDHPSKPISCPSHFFDGTVLLSTERSFMFFNPEL